MVCVTFPLSRGRRKGTEDISIRRVSPLPLLVFVPFLILAGPDPANVMSGGGFRRQMTHVIYVHCTVCMPASPPSFPSALVIHYYSIYSKMMMLSLLFPLPLLWPPAEISQLSTDRLGSGGKREGGKSKWEGMRVFSFLFPLQYGTVIFEYFHSFQQHFFVELCINILLAVTNHFQRLKM